MTVVIEIALSLLLLGGIVAAIVIVRNRPKALKQEYFVDKWKVLQKQCGDKATWALAVIDADKLLDEALKKRKFRGKSMGERLVAAQREISDNDGVWFGHKLRNRLVHEQDVKLKEKDVKQALIGIRQALKDLGALK